LPRNDFRFFPEPDFNGAARASAKLLARSRGVASSPLMLALSFEGVPHGQLYVLAPEGPGDSSTYEQVVASWDLVPVNAAQVGAAAQ
jgi:hypothetical protein